MRVLITGANGQLGKQLIASFGDEEILATTSEQMNLLDGEQISRVVNEFEPELVIHAAAWTNVDEAARQPEAAMAVNGEGTRKLVEAAKKHEARFIYISTNEVFAGDSQEPYVEMGEPQPINAYGASKLAGEKAVQELMADTAWLIARVSWLYGPTSDRNFARKMMQLADERGSLKVVDDEVSTPTYVPDVAEALRQLVDLDISGIVHLVNEGSCSRFEWAKEILWLTGRGDVEIAPIKLADFARASTPPPCSILANVRARQAGVVLPDWHKSLERYARQSVAKQ